MGSVAITSLIVAAICLFYIVSWMCKKIVARAKINEGNLCNFDFRDSDAILLESPYVVLMIQMECELRIDST